MAGVLARMFKFFVHVFDVRLKRPNVPIADWPLFLSPSYAKIYIRIRT